MLDLEGEGREWEQGDLIKNLSVFWRLLKENKNLPVDICVVILFVVDVLFRDANKSGIAMANSKLAVRIPNIRPWKYDGIDEQHCGNARNDFNLQKW